MPRFEGEIQETLLLHAPRERVLHHFSNTHTIARHTVQMEKAEVLDDHEIRFVVKPQASHGVTFTAHYICRYEIDPQGVLRWRSTVSENIWVEGEAHLTALSPTSTRLDYKQSLAMEMQVNRLLAKIIAPLVTKGIRDGVRAYLKAMQDALPS